MTVFVDFAPGPNAPFQFQPTLDGNLYTAIVTWNLFGQRWYLNLYAIDGTHIFTRALVGSPPDYDINLAGGYFTTSTLVFRAATAQFEVSP